MKKTFIFLKEKIKKLEPQIAIIILISLLFLYVSAILLLSELENIKDRKL